GCSLPADSGMTIDHPCSRSHLLSTTCASTIFDVSPLNWKHLAWSSASPVASACTPLLMPVRNTPATARTIVAASESGTQRGTEPRSPKRVCCPDLSAEARPVHRSAPREGG